MYIIKNIVVFFIYNIIDQIQSLVQLPDVGDNDIMIAEAVIRNTTNKLFSTLKLKGIKDKPRLKHFSTVHNYLISLTLQDYNTLKEIEKLTRVTNKNTDNTTQYFMAPLKDLLDEDIKIGDTENNEENDMNTFAYVDNFLYKLKELKQTYGVNNGVEDINSEILKHLKIKDTLILNVTKNPNEHNEDETVLESNEFWEPSGRRIYMGDRTKIKYFPFMASIQFFNQFQCGGSIISSDLVITASSCLQLAWNNRFFRENPAFLSVRVGSSFYSGGGENIAVLEVYFHPEYNPRNLRNNICLLRLVRRLKFKKKQKKIKKINFDKSPSKLPVTTDGITVVGWGAKRASNIINGPWENIISFSVLDFYPLEECQEIYSKEYVTNKNFCAGFFSKGGGACNRDVGGPGIANGILMGVISFGSPICGTPDAPTVFTKLGYYTDWIEEIMEQDVPHRKIRTTLRYVHDIYTPPPKYAPMVPTTFKIPPLVGKMTPIPIIPASPDEDLRMPADGDLFQEFLATMFGSAELEQYQDLLRDNAAVKALPKKELHMKHKINIQVATDAPQFVTKLEDLASEETVTESNKFTVLNENSDDEGDMEKEIVQLIDNTDLKDIIEAETQPKLEKNIAKIENKVDNIKMDDSVLTLLYLSDNEKDKFNGEGFEGEGLSIPAEPFRDMTYRNNGSDVLYDLFPKNELYDLLSEAIDAEFQNKSAKH